MARVEKTMKERENLLRPVRRFRFQMILQAILDHWVGSWSIVGALLLFWLWIDKLFFFIVPNPSLIAWFYGLVTLGVLFLDWYRRPNLFQAAAALDFSAGTRERISSAIELLNHHKTPPDHRWQPSESALWKDALEWTEKLEKKRWYHWRPPKHWKAFVLILAALGLSAFAPNLDLLKRQEQQEKRKAESQNIQKKIARIEHLIERTRQKADEQDLKPVGDLVRKIDTALKELRQRPPSSRREALKKLSKLEDQTEQERQKLEPAKKALEQLGKNPNTKKLAEQLKQGNLKGALEEAQKLQEELNNGELSSEERLQLSKDLKSAMEALNQGQKNPSGTQQGKQGSSESGHEGESHESGSMQELSSLMDQLEGRMAPMGEQALSDQQMGQILDQLAQCKADMSGPMGNKPGKGVRLQRMGKSGQCEGRKTGSGEQEGGSRRYSKSRGRWKYESGQTRTTGTKLERPGSSGSRICQVVRSPAI